MTNQTITDLTENELSDYVDDKLTITADYYSFAEGMVRFADTNNPNRFDLLLNDRIIRSFSRADALSIVTGWNVTR